MKNRGYAINWIVPGLVLLLLWVQPAQAQEPELTVDQTGIVLQGAPGATIYFPVDVRTGPQGAANIGLSIDALSQTTGPNAVILGEQITFSPPGFDLPAGVTRRRVWGKVSPLPAQAGDYGGTLMVTYGVSPTQRLEVPVSLTVHHAPVAVTPLAGPVVQLSGRSGELQTSLRLTAAEEVPGVTLTAEPLLNIDDKTLSIRPDQVALTPATLNLAAGQSVLVTVSISDDILPGTYQGNLFFHQAGQSYELGTRLPVTITAQSTPVLDFSPDNVTAQLIQCGGWLGLDCALARLLPADYLQAGVNLLAKNQTAGPVVIEDIQPGLQRLGAVNLGSAEDLLRPPAVPLRVSPQSQQDLNLSVPAGWHEPGRYKGTVTFYLADEGGRHRPDDLKSVSVDVNIRQGPLGALLLIIIGIAGGRLFQLLSSGQIKLLQQYYQLRRQMLPYESQLPPDDQRRLETYAEDLRWQIYNQELEKMAEKLAAFGQRPKTLLTWRQNERTIAEALQPLEPADQQAVQAICDTVERRIFDDKAVEPVAEVEAILGRVEPLKNLRQLERDLPQAGLSTFATDRLVAAVHQGREMVLAGDIKNANKQYQQTQRAKQLLPAVQQVRKQAQPYKQTDPNKARLLLARADQAERAICDFDFDLAEHWLDQAEDDLLSWGINTGAAASGSAGQSMGGPTAPAAWLSQIATALNSARQQLGQWSQALFQGSAPSGTVTAAADQPTLNRRAGWWLRWQGFIAAIGPELGLRLGTPLVWLITVVLTALIGFYTLYVQQGVTFGANPLWDSVTLLLWGLTSDVAGATLDKLASLRKGGS